MPARRRAGGSEHTSWPLLALGLLTSCDEQHCRGRDTLLWMVGSWPLGVFSKEKRQSLAPLPSPFNGKGCSLNSVQNPWGSDAGEKVQASALPSYTRNLRRDVSEHQHFSSWHKAKQELGAASALTLNTGRHRLAPAEERFRLSQVPYRAPSHCFRLADLIMTGSGKSGPE
nr:uncharacterized protein LOC104652312 [Saimiri boliviensis boliviensis]